MGVLKALQNGQWVPIGGGSSGSSSSEPEVHIGGSEPTNEGVSIWIDTNSTPTPDGTVETQIDEFYQGDSEPTDPNVELWLDTSEEGENAIAETIGALPINGTAADAEKLGGKTPEQFLQPINLLDNSDFTNPVNQRGYVNGTTIGIGNYFIDRWMVPDWDDFTATLNGNGILQTPDYLGHISQRLNNLSSYVGQKMTAVIWYNGYDYPYCACGTVVNTSTETYIASAYGDGAQSLEFKCLGHNLWSVEFCVGGPFEVKHIALYPGEYTSNTVPPYVPKGYGAELIECQRYYENTWFPNDRTQQCEHIAQVFSSAQADVIECFKVTKRATPTITFYPDSSYSTWMVYTTTYFEISAIANGGRGGTKGIHARLSKGSGDTSTWNPMTCIQARGHWEASADL